MQLYQSNTSLTLADPARLLRRLSNHFRHKIAVLDAQDFSLFDFGIGTCELRNDATQLHCACAAANLPDLAAIEETIERHLAGMSGADVTVAWRPRA